MRGEIVRWGVLGLTVLMLAGIQTKVKSFFIDEQVNETLSVQFVDLKKIELIWGRKTPVVGPEQLVAPIKAVFGPWDELPENGEDGRVEDPEDEPPANLIIHVVAVWYPVEGKGVPTILVATNGDRELFAPGEELPGGSFRLESIERVGEGEYQIVIRHMATEETETMIFQGGGA